MKKLVFFIVIFTLFTQAIYADLNLVVTPIKYEIEADPGEVITKTAKIINKGTETVTLTIGKGDFISDNSSGQPIFVKDATGNLATANTELAPWIDYQEETFTIDALETKNISFTVTVPNDASPGGHYGAVFFSYDGIDAGQIKVKADYGVLILVQVAGEINDDTNIGSTAINSPITNDYENYLNQLEANKDNCIVDITGSNVDGSCIDSFDEILDEGEKIIKKVISQDNTTDLNHDTEDSQSSINNRDIPYEVIIPFENNGNTHSKPYGKIEVTDENGNKITNVGKEYIYDNLGNIKGEKIVNYIPINKEGGNVLPGTKRDFIVEMDGIFSQTQQNGDILVTSFSDYFAKKFSENKQKLSPWEMYSYKQGLQKLNLEINSAYTNLEGEEIDFNSANEIFVPYRTRVVTLNPYFFIIFGLLAIIAFILLRLLWWLLFGWKKRKCPKCKKKVKKDMNICPYCGEILKKHKKKNKISNQDKLDEEYKKKKDENKK